MPNYTVYGTLEVKAQGEGKSPKDVLEKAVKNNQFEVLSLKAGTTAKKQQPDNYITITEYVKIHYPGGYGKSYIALLCRTGKIEGAYKIGYTWYIPADTPKIDRRRTSDGKYAGQYEKYGKKQYEKRKIAKLEAENKLADENDAQAPK